MTDERLTVKEFAEKVGKSESTIYRYLGDKKLSQRQCEADGSYTYDLIFLETMFRKGAYGGTRDIGDVYPSFRTKIIGDGFPFYSATTDGRIIDDKTGEEIKPYENSRGYQQVRLTRIGERHLVHRLVLAAFIGKSPTRRHQCDHINGRKTDNRLVNLEWVTPEQNLLRRDKRRNPNPKTPNKFTEEENWIIDNALLYGKTFSEFLNEQPRFIDHISAST